MSLYRLYSICIYIYKQTENLHISDLFKTSGKSTIRIKWEGGRGVFSEAKPQASNSKQLPREEQGRCLRAQPGNDCPPREGSCRHLGGPRPAPTPCPAASPPSQPLLLHHFLCPSSRAPLPLTSRPFSSPSIRPQPAPPRTPASPPSSPRPAALTLPGFQQHRVGHDVLDFHGRGLLPLRAAGAGGRPYSLLRPLLQPRHRRGAKPRLIRPQRTSALRSPLPHHPLLAPAPRSPSPRAETESRQRPPAPAMAPPPASGSTAPAPPPPHSYRDYKSQQAERGARWGHVRAISRGPAGICSAPNLPRLRPKAGGEQSGKYRGTGRGSRERWRAAGARVVVLGTAG